jgi:hypothetical protein
VDHAQQQQASKYEALVEERDRLLSRQYLRAGRRGFSAAKIGIRDLFQLYREAGLLGYEQALSPDQRRSLMLIQLESIALAMKIERYMIASIGRTEDQGLASEARSFAQFAVDERPGRWPVYDDVNILKFLTIQRINEISRAEEAAEKAHYQPNPLFDDPGVMARSAFILIELRDPAGEELLLAALDKEPNDIHVRAVGALSVDRGSDLEKELLTGLPQNYVNEIAVLRSIRDRTEKVSAFWDAVGLAVVAVIARKFEYEASLRSKGLCTTCAGKRKVRRTANTVNGYSTVTSSSSNVIDCPVCNATGKSR